MKWDRRKEVIKGFEQVRLLEAFPYIVWHCDSEGLLDYVNERGVRALDLTPETLSGWGWLQGLHPDDREWCRSKWEYSLRSGSPFHHECRLMGSDKTYRWYFAQGVPLLNDASEIEGWLGTLADIDTRKRVERELKRDALLLANVRDAVIVTNLEGKVTYWNEEATRLLGWNAAEMLHTPLAELPEPLHTLMTEVVRAPTAGDMWSGELALESKAGKEIWVDGRIAVIEGHRGEPWGLMGLFHDVSDRRRATTELRRIEMQHRQAQKMEALGQLAGGVAHDFNNLLTVIAGHGEVLSEALLPGEAPHSSVQEILDAVERASDLTRQLLVFGRRDVRTSETSDLNGVVRDIEKMLRRLIGENIRLSTDIAPGAAPVGLGSSQIEQILINLAVNARDAMPAGGELLIETRVLEADEGKPQGGEGSERSVELTVRDTGTGMTEEVQRHLFEPFFTTKGPGRGTGLGLALVYGIVEQSGGYTEVDSELGRGTTFRIALPWTEPVPRPEVPDPELSEPGIPARSATVLLVEDDDSVRELAHDSLRRAGYHVLVADRGVTAIRQAIQYAGTIHLLVTDVVLPGRGGWRLAERLRDLFPSLKVLFISGYTEDDVVRQGVRRDEVPFLHKPFSPSVLVTKVREVLGAPEPVFQRR